MLMLMLELELELEWSCDIADDSICKCYDLALLMIFELEIPYLGDIVMGEATFREDGDERGFAAMAETRTC